MKAVRMLTILSALVPAAAVAGETPRKVAEPAPPVARTWPNPADLVVPGVLRQDLFDRRNPTNLRNDYRTPPAQPGQF